MDINEIRKLIREGHSVVLLQEGHPPLQVTELKVEQSQEEEVQIASRWPKARTVLESRQDQVLERLNKEILALKAQIAQEEESN